MTSMKFPTNNDEFLDLLIFQNAAHVENWVCKDKQFDPAAVVEYLFLRDVWNGIENPAESSFTQAHLNHRLENYERNPHTENRAVLAVIEKMLALGVSSREISTLVREAHFNIASYILYKLDDAEGDHSPEIARHMRLGIYLEDEDGNPIPGSRQSFQHQLAWARPAAFPPVW